MKLVHLSYQLEEAASIIVIGVLVTQRPAAVAATEARAAANGALVAVGVFVDALGGNGALTEADGHQWVRGRRHLRPDGMFVDGEGLDVSV